ncbi:MAG: hypothetical protein K2L88_03950, partial [Clostridiales bacterium]|nr:hypothetical protein [Clostridiales bacterium]
DRFGSGSSDVCSSSSVRIILEVVNTKPAVKNSGFYSELSVKPISDGNKIVTPDVTSLLANGNGNNSGLMVDHDSDVPEYMMARGVAVVNKAFIDDYEANTLVKADGAHVDNLAFDTFDNLAEKYTRIAITDNYKIDITRFVTAEIISRRELTAKAISSTKAIEGGVYVVFFVTDNNGGISLGYARIEVLNTAPTLNESDENGFNAANPLWYIESASDADITRNRYIVGSAEAAYAINNGEHALNNAALDIDIKLIAVDDDGLHNKTVLSQVSAATVSGKTTYTYATLDKSSVTETELQKVVPNVVNGSEFGTNKAAVTVFTRTTGTEKNENGEYSVWYKDGGPNGADDNNVYDLHFYVEGQWYTRDALISALAGGALDLDTCFDADGRFVVTEWALRLMSGVGFSSNVDLGLNIALRDQAELGGSTAGLKTSYHSDRNHKNGSGALDNRDIVEGGLIATVYQHISKTGIHSVNEYLGVNNNYYTVEYTPAGGNTVKYVSTYDGDTTSTYSNAQDLRYNAEFKKLSSDGDTLLKSRSGADNTLAGVNSGAVFSGAAIEGAFTYTDTIEVPANIATGTPATGDTVTYNPVYVPMSYFGSLSALVGRKDSGEISYYTNEFVGYDINKGTVADLKLIDRVYTAMTLSDGTHEWSGADIKDNPYIHIGTFDWYHDNNAATNSLALLDDPYSKPYYNNRLAVLTVDPKTDTLVGYEKIASNCNSFVGDGRLMYLEEQATKLIEHNFGLTFTKKNVRTSTRSLTLRIDLVRYSENKVAIDSLSGLVEDEDRCTAEVKIHVENTKMDLYNAENNSSTVKYEVTDENTGAGTYYVDLTVQSSGSASYTLSRKASSAQAGSTDRTVIEY